MNDAFGRLETEAAITDNFAHNVLNDFLLYELLICVCREIIKANAAQKPVGSSRDSVFSQFQRLVSQHHKDTQHRPLNPRASRLGGSGFMAGGFHGFTRIFIFRQKDS